MIMTNSPRTPSRVAGSCMKARSCLNFVLLLQTGTIIALIVQNRRRRRLQAELTLERLELAAYPAHHSWASSPKRQSAPRYDTDVRRGHLEIGLPYATQRTCRPNL